MNHIADIEFLVMAHDRNCNGCIATKKDVMISYYLKLPNQPNRNLVDNWKDGDLTKDWEIIDLFLTQEQAESLCKSLERAIFDNHYNENKEFLKSLV